MIRLDLYGQHLNLLLVNQYTERTARILESSKCQNMNTKHLSDVSSFIAMMTFNLRIIKVIQSCQNSSVRQNENSEVLRDRAKRILLYRNRFLFFGGEGNTF